MLRYRQERLVCEILAVCYVQALQFRTAVCNTQQSMVGKRLKVCDVQRLQVLVSIHQVRDALIRQVEAVGQGQSLYPFAMHESLCSPIVDFIAQG